MSVVQVKTMWELDDSVGYPAYQGVIDILQNHPEIQADTAVSGSWHRVKQIEFNDTGVSISYSNPNARAPLDLCLKIHLGHVSKPLKNNKELNDAVRQKLIDILANGGTIRKYRNTIVGADVITIERFNPTSDRATLYFENK